MARIKDILQKELFTIQDFALIIRQTTDCIRNWEFLGILPKHTKKSENGWKLYSKEDLANYMEILVNHPWERMNNLDFEELKYYIKYLRNDYEKRFNKLVSYGNKK